MHSWNCISIYYVDKTRAVEDYSEVTTIGMDETSKKGHNYITVVADLSQRKVIFVTDGKDSTTVQRFAADFEARRGNTERVGLITCDMSLGFRKGIQESFENSQTIIDKFHVIKHANHPDPIICPLVEDCMDIKNICSLILPIANSEEPSFM